MDCGHVPILSVYPGLDLWEATKAQALGGKLVGQHAAQPLAEEHWGHATPVRLLSLEWCKRNPALRLSTVWALTFCGRFLEHVNPQRTLLLAHMCGLWLLCLG